MIAGPEELAEAGRGWATEPDLVEDVCLTLARRVAMAGGDDLGAAVWAGHLQDAPSAGWLALVVGEVARTTDGAERAGDGGSALDLARVGRLPRAVWPRVLERLLWQRRAHPRTAVYECRHGLTRDLLLVGSDYARAQDAMRRKFPYLPRDLRPDDRPLFSVACEFFDWAVTPTATVPVGYSLP